MSDPQPSEQEQHEQRIRDLAHMRTDRPHSFENLLDNADAAYSLAHDAGLLRDKDGKEEPFEWPSVKQERLYQEQLKEIPRPKTLASAHKSSSNKQESDHFYSLSDPRVALVGSKDPVAILEGIQDNDLFYGSSTITWLGCDSYEEAVAYCEAVGWSHEMPGAGEEDGVYTNRTIYDNPRYLEQKNAQLGEVDHTAVELAVVDIISKVGLDPRETIAELAIIKGISYDLADWNRKVSSTMLSSENKRQARAYLNTRGRQAMFRGARGAIGGVVQEATKQIAESMNGHAPQPFDEEDLEAIGVAANAITDALQTRHELRDATAESIEVVIKGFLRIARMKALAKGIFKAHGSEDVDKEWNEQVEETLMYSVRKISEKYSAAMRNFIDGDHLTA